MLLRSGAHDPALGPTPYATDQHHAEEAPAVDARLSLIPGNAVRCAAARVAGFSAVRCRFFAACTCVTAVPFCFKGRATHSKSCVPLPLHITFEHGRWHAPLARPSPATGCPRLDGGRARETAKAPTRGKRRSTRRVRPTRTHAANRAIHCPDLCLAREGRMKNSIQTASWPCTTLSLPLPQVRVRSPTRSVAHGGTQSRCFAATTIQPTRSPRSCCAPISTWCRTCTTTRTTMRIWRSFSVPTCSTP